MACMKKKFDKEEAMMTLAKCQFMKDRLHNGKRKEKRMYLCEKCNSWHLTSKTKKAFLKKKKKFEKENK